MGIRSAAFIALSAVALLLPACGPADRQPLMGARTSGQSPTPQPTAEPTTVTLRVWDQFQRDTEKALIDALNREFEASHPGVKIKRTVKSFDDLKTTVRAGLTDPNGPDVVQVNQGADMRSAVQAGLLLDLTPYLSKYRWDERFSPGILARNTFSSDGARFGTGSLFGVSPTAEVVGVYYNKDKFTALGLKVPNTLAEFESLLAKARAAGETPIMFGNRESWPGIHIFSAVEHILLPSRAWLDDFVYGRGNVSFSIPENAEAAARVQQWVRAGYFTGGFSQIGYEDSWKQFASGKGLLMLTGSWLSADIVRTGGEKFGFFLLPPVQPDRKVLAAGGVGVPFCIRRGSRNADLAAEYLDWMVSTHAGELWLEEGVLAAVPVHQSKIPVGTLLGDIVVAYSSIKINDRVGHYIDWAGPTLYDRLGSGITDLMALGTTPEEFVTRIQADYARQSSR
jgi:raffinose/stachyose/melibiose transport system substrate-binding protein